MKSHDILQKVGFSYLLLIIKAICLLITLIALTKGHPRLFWKEHEHEYPVLARMARDILSTPASGAGVERLFNCARDVCHYRRGQLKPDTIKHVMLHLFSSKFDLEQGELEMIKEYLSAGEAAMLDQTWKPVPALDEIEPISDNEEDDCQAEDTSEDDTDDDEDDGEEELTLTQAITESKQTRRKRPRSKTTEATDDGDNGLQLPEMPTEESMQARSGRIRKKPRLPDGFEIDKL
jgi:hAT family protein